MFKSNDVRTLNYNFFYRKFFFFNYFTLQSSIESNNIFSFDKKELFPHQKHHINDFKGIESFGLQTHSTEENLLESWRSKQFLYSNGFLNCYKFYNKIYFNLFNTFETNENSIFSLQSEKDKILPYIHFNFLFIPKPIEIKEKEMYFSYGLGLNYLTKNIAFDFYYNTQIDKSNYDLAQTFGVTLGID